MSRIKQIFQRLKVIFKMISNLFSIFIANSKLFVFLFVIILDSSWAGTPYDEIQFKNFDSRIGEFESNIYVSLQTTENFFAREEVVNIVDGGTVVVSFMPYIGQLAWFVPVLRNTLADESDWKETFTKAIVHETQLEITENNIRIMESAMQAIHDKISLLSNEKNPDYENRKTVATILHTKLDEMINFFGDRNALFVKYPLIGAPPLIQLGLLVALFTPMANTLVPEVAKSPQISCKMRDVLLRYRPRTVRARFDKFSSSNTLLYKMLSEVMVQPYNEYGYNSTSIMDCQPVRRSCLSSMYLMDEFNTDDYCADGEISNCFRGYAQLVRHRVEKLFPDKRLSSLCVGAKPNEKTGRYLQFEFVCKKNI